MPRKKKPWPPKYGVPDEDSPEWTAEDFARARPFAEMFPHLVEAAEQLRERARLGRPKLEHPKEHVTLRLDAEVVNGFKEDGPGWQGRINETLLKAVRRRKPAKRKKRSA
jgi:uncharacterized protein (DUF4415 family)